MSRTMTFLSLKVPCISLILSFALSSNAATMFKIGPSPSFLNLFEERKAAALLERRDLQETVDPCSGNSVSWITPNSGECMEGWSSGNAYTYPDDFEGILNEVSIYTCPTSAKRIVVSNGIPDHDVEQNNPNSPCETFWYVEMPLNPARTDTRTEPAPLGIVAIALNGVPAYGANEAGGVNAAEPSEGSVQDAQFWYGHAAFSGDWHFHNPNMGNEETPTSTQLLGYALDGFPIYGPVDDASLLDECNGFTDGDGNYQYHVRTVDQVDETLDYCTGTDEAVNWSYILGCYYGDLSETVVSDYMVETIPDDCVLESLSTPVPSQGSGTTPAPSQSSSTTPAPTVIGQSSNPSGTLTPTSDNHDASETSPSFEPSSAITDAPTDTPSTIATTLMPTPDGKKGKKGKNARKGKKGKKMKKQMKAKGMGMKQRGRGKNKKGMGMKRMGRKRMGLMMGQEPLPEDDDMNDTSNDDEEGGEEDLDDDDDDEDVEDMENDDVDEEEDLSNDDQEEGD